mmetsp:Transcript_89788/g.155497  ORF Transcript_89788/g.155497 Transcript_89788/m.155497 type:complete len:87 (-) Transcript_89788:139-399(-)
MRALISAGSQGGHLDGTQKPALKLCGAELALQQRAQHPTPLKPSSVLHLWGCVCGVLGTSAVHTNPRFSNLCIKCNPNVMEQSIPR